MKRKRVIQIIIPALMAMLCSGLLAQTVPAGIHYQAVARNASGNEMANQDISVRFSILSDNPDGPVVYQEIHDVRTTEYGVFSLIIGGGTYSGGTKSAFSEIPWETSSFWVRVEVKFSNEYLDMGTMQFLAVPYALYAKKSLEPGPQGPLGPVGPKGNQGDPATDNQKLSFDGTNLSISENGNTVNLSTLNVAHNLTILGDTLSIYGGNKVGLPNYMQDLTLDVNDILKVTKNTSASSINLSKYLDNTDSQTLSFDSETNKVSVSGGNYVDLSKFHQQLSYNTTTNKLSISNMAGEIDLTPLKNDADADPTNEIQDLNLSGNELTITGKASPTKINLGTYLDNTDNQILSYNQSNYTLSLTNGGNAVIGNLIAFRARKTISETGLSFLTDYDFIPANVEYNDSNGYDGVTGMFLAPCAGIYTFNVSYTATGSGDARSLKIFLNGGLYDILNSSISSNTSLTRSVTMKLVAGDRVKVIINTGTSTESGIGTFSGFRVY